MNSQLVDLVSYELRRPIAAWRHSELEACPEQLGHDERPYDQVNSALLHKETFTYVVVDYFRHACGSNYEPNVNQDAERKFDASLYSFQSFRGL